MDDDPPRPRTLVVELLMAAPSRFDAERFEAAVRQTIPASRLVPGDRAGAMVAHDDYPLTYADGQTASIVTAVMPAGQHAATVDTSQSWRFPGARDAVASATTRCLVVEILGMAHAAADRVRCFHVGLCAAIEQLQPVALWVPQSEQVVEPSEAVAHPLAALVNVRMWRVEGGPPGTVLMDSIGMHVLHLPDVQCRFTGIDASAMAGVLYDMVNYLFESGDVIEDGHTISGVTGRERWPCRHAMASMAPERVVIDIDAGGSEGGRWRRRG